MKQYDTAVIGAGLLGVFAARSLRRYGLKVCVLEWSADVCTGISKANAAIVYSGYDTAPNTLKSALCVPAAEHFSELCEELGVRFSRCGSLSVCFGPEGEKSIRKKYAQGLANGVAGLRLLTGAEVLALEPGLNPSVRMGLLASGAGTVEPWELGIAAYENARSNGAEFFFETEVQSVSKEGGLFAISTGRGSFFAKSVINCAGLRSTALRETLLPPKIGIRTSVSDFAVFGAADKNYVNRIIFEELENGKKGVTLVPTVEGNLLAESPLKIKTDDFLPRCTQEGLDALYRLSGELLPALKGEPAIRHFAALRPNPYDTADPKRRIDSFTVLEEDGMISLIGIKTPGLTCAEALGRLAAEKAVAFLGGAPENETFCPVRKAPVRLAGLSEAERTAKIRENSLYGKIICRCGNVSEGEVLDAIRAGARSIDGVKRRCGTGFGACQGSFCTGRIVTLLARELGASPEEVLKRHD